MINHGLNVFPGNVVSLVGGTIEAIDDDIILLKRPLRPSDPNLAVGVYGTVWTPNEDSLEIGHVGPSEPTLGQYQLGVQTLVKDGDTERALATSNVLSKHVRTVLYRNNALRVALGQLSVQDGTSVERLRRWGIKNQRFMANDIEGTFVTISVMDLWIETEMS